MKKPSPSIQWAALGLLLLLGWAVIDWPALVQAVHDRSGPPSASDNPGSTVISDSVRAVASFARMTKAKLTRPARIAAMVEAENTNANLWGLTVDQDDAPLPGVRVDVVIRQLRAVSSVVIPDFIPRQAISGTNGRFAITGARGDLLEIRALEKPGYQPERTTPKAIGFGAEYDFPTNSAHPIVFKLWKESARQPLILREPHLWIVPDGRPYIIDLATGKQTPSDDAVGDVRIRVTRPMTAGLWDHFAWSYDLEPLNGGLIEIPKEIYLAPSEGYTNRFHSVNPATTSGWSAFHRAQFVLKLRGGQAYARLKLEVWAQYGDNPRDGLIILHSAFNPTGSPRLN